jgi:hypothetical protein
MRFSKNGTKETIMYDEPAPQSMLSWMASSLGIGYLVLLPLAGLLCFVLTLIVVIRGKGPMAAAAVVLIAPVPFLIGIFAGIQGMISSYQVIAMSGATPRPSEMAAGISTALFAPLVGLMLTSPAYATAVLGALIRGFASRAEDSPKH